MAEDRNPPDPFRQKSFPPRGRKEVLEVLQRIEHAPMGRTDSEIRYLVRKANRLRELERRTRLKVSEDMAGRIRQFRLATKERVEDLIEGVYQEWSQVLELKRKWGQDEGSFLRRKLERFAKVKEDLKSAGFYEEAAKVREEERTLELRLRPCSDKREVQENLFPGYGYNIEQTRNIIGDIVGSNPDPDPMPYPLPMVERWASDTWIQRVDLWVDSVEAEKLRFSPLDPTQELIEADEEGGRFRYWIIPSEKFIRKVMMMGDRVKLLEPCWMVDELKGRLERASAYYR